MTASTTGGSCLTAKGLDISLAALQRQDPYINNIVDVASQVALYTFNSKSNEWVSYRSYKLTTCVNVSKSIQSRAFLINILAPLASKH